MSKCSFVMPVLVAFTLISCGEDSKTKPAPMPDKVQTSNSRMENVIADPLLDEIEKKIVMPGGAKHLSHYLRIYVWSQGRSKILGQYELSDSPGRVWLKGEIPSIFDGGCSVINIKFDVRSRLVETVACHGEA